MLTPIPRQMNLIIMGNNQCAIDAVGCMIIGLDPATVEHIKLALAETGGHRSQTADLLGISRKVLWEKMRDFGIVAPGEDEAEKEP